LFVEALIKRKVLRREKKEERREKERKLKIRLKPDTWLKLSRCRGLGR
jgi:hypothetical protein